jgi:glycosyltransferase involved in cell wall biosynthesis
MIVGVDASNLSTGGSATHLVELLSAAQPQEHDISQVIVWGGKTILNQIEDRLWLQKIHEPLLDKSLPIRLYWQLSKFDQKARMKDCDILFIPGGSYFGSFRPFVTMSQNMLPFEWASIRRYGISWLVIKNLFLRRSLVVSFRRANGLVFLTEYAKAAISPFIASNRGMITRIPHGVDERFRKEPKPQSPITTYSSKSAFLLLYVSQVTPYKHQSRVIEAVSQLRQMGLPLELELVGSIDHAEKKFSRSLSKWDPKREWIRFRGEVPFNTMHKIYQKADLFVFASSCENMPIVLLEAMAAGLPIASSNLGPMPEMLDNAAIFFDPNYPIEIANAIKILVDDPYLREEKSWASYEASKPYTWRRCAYETFDFIAKVGQCEREVKHVG